jgi:SAM-dependent methyltransferase
MKCRHCGDELSLLLIDLGSAPPSNAYLTTSTLHSPEKWFPLKVLVCNECWLVQTEDTPAAGDLFGADYAYFSAYSTTWLQHAERYVGGMQARFNLNDRSHFVEVAANDGYLLQYGKARGIPCLGIEPTASTAAAARARGLNIIEDFFGERLARKLVAQGKQADFITANNVLAHVPDINDFVAGVTVLLKPKGIATFEFPHLLRLMAEDQFDTIYHEHFSYLSLTAVIRIFAHNGLEVFDVEEHATHGGSLRVFAQRTDTVSHPPTTRVAHMLAQERAAGMTTSDYYADFQTRADQIKNAFLAFLIAAKNTGKKVSAYGAAAKGNTLLNYAGVRSDLLPWVIDRNLAKQGKYLPGSRIPIVDETHLHEERPDYVVILPWNLREEVMAQLDYIREWRGQFVTAVPSLVVS